MLQKGPTIIRSMNTGPLGFREVFYPSGFAMPPHDHTISCLVFPIRGAFDCLWCWKTEQASSSSLFYVPAGAQHANRFPVDATTFDIVFDAGWGDRFGESTYLLDEPMLVPGQDLHGLVTKAHREFAAPDDLSSLILQALAIELTACLVRRKMSPPEPKVPSWLRKVRDLLAANQAVTLSLDDIAIEVGIHPSHLTREFRRHYGCSVGEYVRELRVQYSSHLIANTDMNLTEIAVESGFADQSHFTRTFKALRGQTPSQYRADNSRF